MSIRILLISVSFTTMIDEIIKFYCKSHVISQM